MAQRWMEQASVAVAPITREDSARRAAVELARDLALPCLASCDTRDGEFDLLLVVGGSRLELREIGRGAAGPIYVDFVSGSTGYRHRSNTSLRQPIAASVGLRTGTRTVLDATAGLGQDAFHLASLGCEVRAVERSRVLAALLRDGLDRAARSYDDRLRAIVHRIELVVGDAREVLERLTGEGRPDVVYLDPMYTPRRRARLANKQMRICRRLVGDDADARDLFDIAYRRACRRVVVKRHRHAPALSPEPNARHVGKIVRYDVYHVRATDEEIQGRMVEP